MHNFKYFGFTLIYLMFICSSESCHIRFHKCVSYKTRFLCYFLNWRMFKLFSMATDSVSQKLYSLQTRKCPLLIIQDAVTAKLAITLTLYIAVLLEILTIFFYSKHITEGKKRFRKIMVSSFKPVIWLILSVKFKDNACNYFFFFSEILATFTSLSFSQTL